MHPKILILSKFDYILSKMWSPHSNNWHCENLLKFTQNLLKFTQNLLKFTQIYSNLLKFTQNLLKFRYLGLLRILERPNWTKHTWSVYARGWEESERPASACTVPKNGNLTQIPGISPVWCYCTKKVRPPLFGKNHDFQFDWYLGSDRLFPWDFF